MSTGDDDIAMARSRIANGQGDVLDEWRVKRAERVVTKDISALDIVYKQNDDAIDAWGEWFDGEMKARWVDPIGDVVAEMSRELRAAFVKQMRELEIQVAELKGELRAMRG